MLDFIERYLGVAPDKGDGIIEFLLSVFLIVLMVAIVVRLNITKNGPS